MLIMPRWVPSSSSIPALGETFIRQFRQMAKRGKLKFFTILTDKHPQSDGGQASSFDHLFELPGIVRVMIAIRV
jgi:hypothetical protein